MMGRGLYGKLSPDMTAQADAMARQRCNDPDKLPVEIVKARCERAARLFFPPVEYIVVVSGFHEPQIDPARWYVFVLAEDFPYHLICGWLRGSEMVGKRIKLQMLHKVHELIPAIRAARIAEAAAV